MTKHMFQGEAELSAGRKDMDGAVIQPSSSPLDGITGITVRTFVSAGAHIDPLKECLRVQGGERKDKAKRKFVKALLARRRQEAPIGWAKKDASLTAHSTLARQGTD